MSGMGPSNGGRRGAAVMQALLNAPATAAGAPTAVFDFDKTLTVRDTFLPWLTVLRGRRRTLAAGLASLRSGLPGVSRGGSARDATKAGMARRLLTGVPAADAQAAARRLAPRVLWSGPLCDRLQEHLQLGHAVLVATGSCRIAVAEMVAYRFGADAALQVIGTELDEDAGTLTGRLAGGNCIGENKAARVRHWLEQAGQAGGWGYGNPPWDLPMLALMQHRVAV
jgi:phosphatidylglycerophosphatase C